MLGRKEKRERDHILASMVWYVALSFWILLSTLDRQLNKKTHQLPMCLHGSWFSWKQWDGWNAERAKPWSGVWGWVHHIYTGPQARRGKRLVCTPKVPLSISHLPVTLFSLISTLPSINQALIKLANMKQWKELPQKKRIHRSTLRESDLSGPGCQMSPRTSNCEVRG